MTTRTTKQAVEEAVEPLEETKPRAKSRTRRAVPPPPEPGAASRALSELTGGAVKIEMVPLARLRPHPDNPRRDVGDVTELADSIRAHGVRQNLLVVPDPGDPEAFRIVIGHRRDAAARRVGLAALPAVVDDTLTPADQLELMLLENLQRVDLSALEEADAYQGLLDLGLDEKAIAARTGRARSTVKSRLRLRSLPEPAREAVHHHQLTLEDAAALNDLSAEDQQRVVASIGKSNFTTTLASARAGAAERARWQPLLDVLTGANATELERNAWSDPEGSTRYLPTPPEGVDLVDQLRADIAAGWSWRWYYGQLQIFRPFTLQEAQERAERDEQEARRAEQNAAEQAAAAARRAAREQLARVSAATRRAFLTHLVRERKTLTKDQQAALVEYAADVVVNAPWTGRYLGGRYRYTPQSPAASPLADWFGVERPANLRELGYTDRENEFEALEAALGSAAVGLPAPQRLLAALAAANEPVESDAWRDAPTSPQLLRWYTLLDQLGYAPSAEEAAALADPDGGR